VAEELRPFHLAVPVDDHDGGSDTNPVDGDKVPAKHFGVVLDMSDWEQLAKHLESADCDFKSFADTSQLFAT